MRKKGVILSEPLGILIALLIMLAIFAFLFIIEQQNRQALAQSIEIGQRTDGVEKTVEDSYLQVILLESDKMQSVQHSKDGCRTCDISGK